MAKRINGAPQNRIPWATQRRNGGNWDGTFRSIRSGFDSICAQNNKALNFKLTIKHRNWEGLSICIYLGGGLLGFWDEGFWGTRYLSIRVFRVRIKVWVLGLKGPFFFFFLWVCCSRHFVLCVTVYANCARSLIGRVSGSDQPNSYPGGHFFNIKDNWYQVYCY